MKRDIFSTMKAKKAAVQYGHPSKGVQLILVSGNGSTTVSRLLAELLREAGKRVAVFTSRGSFVEDIPYVPRYDQTPVTIQQALSAARKQHCDVVIMEMVGVLTKGQVLSTLHIDMALVTDDSRESDALLDQPMVYAVLPYGRNTERLPVAPHQLINVGEDEAAEARISNIKLYRKGTELMVTIDHQTIIELATHLVGRSNAISAAFAAAAGYVLGVSVDIIPEGVARLEGLPGNYQTLDTEASYQVVVDAASSQQSIEAVVASAKQLAKRRLMVVLDASVDDVVAPAIKPEVDRLIGVSGHSQVLTDEGADLAEAVAIALRAAKKDDLILLVGQDFARLAKDGMIYGQELVEANRGE